MKRLCSYFQRQIDTSECWGAVLFGLIMVLIITLGARSIVSQGEDAARDMLVAAVGCNLAWGIIQGWLFVLDKLFERGRLAKLALEVQESTDEGAALEMIRDEHDPDLDKVASVEERARLYLHILDNVKATPVARTRLRCGDLAGAFVVFLLVSLTAVPAVVPFLLIDDLRTALRVSNFLLVSLLFLVGHQWAAITNMNRWTTGLSIMVVGIGMVAIGEALGG